jgi:hypothetical protein
MTDFAEAFNRGQEAALIAAKARAQVDEVFENAKMQLLKVTDGQLELGRARFAKPKKRTNAAEFLASGALGSLFDNSPAEMELWIAARNPKAVDAAWIKLAKWDRPTDGFPCLLSYDNKEVRCHDQESLADAIAELLASSWGGEKLHELLNRPAKPDAAGAHL